MNSQPVNAPGGIRTPDTRFRTPVLYPLSYGYNSISAAGIEPAASPKEKLAPFNYHSLTLFTLSMHLAGIEPATSGFADRRSIH